MSGTQVATTQAAAAADVVAVQVLNAKTGQMVTARIPAELAERFPSYGGIEELAELSDEVFGDNGGNLSVGDLVRVKVPDGNSVAFTVNDEAEKSIKGIIILRQERRNYWEKSIEEGGNSAPDCYSRDAVVGVGQYGKGSEENPTGKCADCPLSQWADGADGKRIPPPCHEQEAVLILTEEMAFPLLVTVPRTSIKNFRTYWKNTLYMAKMKSTVEVVTEIGLSRTKNDAGTAYNELTFTLAEDLTKGMDRADKNAYKLAPLALAEQFRSILANVDTAGDAVASGDATGDDPDGGRGVGVVSDDVVDEYANAGQTAG